MAPVHAHQLLSCLLMSATHLISQIPSCWHWATSPSWDLVLTVNLGSEVRRLALDSSCLGILHTCDSQVMSVLGESAWVLPFSVLLSATSLHPHHLSDTDGLVAPWLASCLHFLPRFCWLSDLLHAPSAARHDPKWEPKTAAYFLLP